VLNSLRGCICDGEAGSPRRVYDLTLMAQVSRDIPGLMRNQAALLIFGLLIVLVVGGVIFPAIWSSKKTRRTAALEVLDRILRWRR
jgi:hypothetical protein